MTGNSRWRSRPATAAGLRWTRAGHEARSGTRSVSSHEARSGARGASSRDRPETRLASRLAARLRPADLVRRTALPAADVAGLIAAVAVSGAGRAALPAAVYAALVLAVLGAGRMHRLRVCLRVSDQAGQLLAAAAIPLPVLAAWQADGPAVLARLVLATTVGMLCARLAVCAALRAAHRRGWLTERAVVVGAGTFGAYIAELMREHPEFGLTPAGFVDDGPPRRDLAVPTLGTMRELAGVITRFGIGRVVVCFSSDCRDENLVGVVQACRPLLVDICVAPRLYELGMAVPRSCLDEIWGVPLIPLRQPPRAGLAVKRAMDLAAALVLGLITAPLTLALAALIRISSGPPVLFRQARVTRDGTETRIVKLRTVPADGDPAAGHPDTRWTVDEQRCSPLGRWLRATHLDELPQLGNVLRGEMSLVGPRPERPYFAARFRHDIPRYADRTRMLGGITGWAQVNGLNGDTSVFDRARFDNYYAEYWSPWLDTVILAQTAVQVVWATLGLT
jgi:exopolysaccharide biosynthesis polyprenyl glycosylphosphotransferase